MKTSFAIPLLALMFSGCAVNSQPELPIPHRGDIVAQGSGQLSYRAQAPGLVSVYDANSNSIVSSTAVGESAVVTVDPHAGTITVTDANRTGAQVIHSDISKSHRYELWFIPQGTSTTRWSS